MAEANATPTGPQAGTPEAKPLTCAQCATPVSLAPGEQSARCPACGALVRGDGGGTYFGLGWRFAIAANVLVLVVIAFGIVIGVNYLANRYAIRRDATSQRTYTLSPRSKALLNELAKSDKKVQIWFLVGRIDERTDDVVTHTIHLLEEYKVLCQEHIDFEQYSLMGQGRKVLEVCEKTGMNPREDLDPDGNEVVFFCEANKKHKVVKFSELSESSYGEYDANPETPKYKFKGESVLTSGIQTVYEGKPTNIYYVKGHDELDKDNFQSSDGLSAFDGLLKRREGYETKTLNLASGDIPADADALVIVRPRKKLATSEIDRLTKYMENGGRLLILFNSDADEGKTDVEPIDELSILCQNWGIEVGRDFIIETDQNHMKLWIDPRSGAKADPSVFNVTDYGWHEITGKMKNIATWFFVARTISKAKQPPEGISITELARTTEQSFAVPDDFREKESTPADQARWKHGPLSVAACAEKSTGTGADLKKGRLVVIGDADFIDNKHMEDVGSYDLVTNSLAWLVNKSYQITEIDPKEVEDKKLNLTADQQRKVLAITVAAIPGFFVMMAIITWLFRRK